MYRSTKFRLLMTVVKFSVLHTLGKITKGDTLVASPILLKAVSIIHKNGTSMVMDTRIRMA
jgi:hypothetical protein